MQPVGCPTAYGGLASDSVRCAAAYDLQTADGIRILRSDRHDVVERKMMGGLVFMVAGNMCCVVSGRGGLMDGRAAQDGLRARDAGGKPHGGGVAEMGQARPRLRNHPADQSGAAGRAKTPVRCRAPGQMNIAKVSAVVKKTLAG